jgi:hypothetical protein
MATDNPRMLITDPIVAGHGRKPGLGVGCGTAEPFVKGQGEIDGVGGGHDLPMSNNAANMNAKKNTQNGNDQSARFFGRANSPKNTNATKTKAVLLISML